MPDLDPNYVDPILLSEIGRRIGAGSSLGDVRLFLENWGIPEEQHGHVLAVAMTRLGETMRAFNNQLVKIL